MYTGPALVLEDGCGKLLVVDPCQQSFRFHVIHAFHCAIVHEQFCDGLVPLPDCF